MPVTDVRAAVRRPTAMAIASSSSRSSGGMAVPAAQPVAAGRPGHRLDGIAELAQALDVPPDRAPRDAQALGQGRARPVAASLQQRQEVEEAAGGVAHGSMVAEIADGS